MRALVACVVVACGGNPSGSSDGGHDPHDSATTDVSPVDAAMGMVDGSVDVDAPADAMPDAPPDAMPDAMPDGSCDDTPAVVDFHRVTLTVTSTVTRTIALPTGNPVTIDIRTVEDALDTTIAIRERLTGDLASLPEAQVRSTGYYGCASLAAGDYDVEVALATALAGDHVAVRRVITPITIAAAQTATITIPPLPALATKAIAIDLAPYGPSTTPQRGLQVAMVTEDRSLEIRAPFMQPSTTTPSFQMPLPERTLVPHVYLQDVAQTASEPWELGAITRTALSPVAASPTYVLAVPARVALSGTIIDPATHHRYLGTVTCTDVANHDITTEAWFYQQYDLDHAVTVQRQTRCDISPRYYMAIGDHGVYLTTPYAGRERVTATTDFVRDFTVPEPPAAPHTISGTLVDPNGQAVPWKEINVRGTPTSIDALLERLDDWIAPDGVFQLALPPGTYTFEIAPWS